MRARGLFRATLMYEVPTLQYAQYGLSIYAILPVRTSTESVPVLTPYRYQLTSPLFYLTAKCSFPQRNLSNGAILSDRFYALFL